MPSAQPVRLSVAPSATIFGLNMKYIKILKGTNTPLGNVKSCVIVARKIEIHCRYAHAFETAFGVCRGVRCAQRNAAFFAGDAFLLACVEPDLRRFFVALHKPVHVLVVDEHMVLLAQSVKAKYGCGAVFKIVFVRFHPRFCAAQSGFFSACANAADFGVFKFDACRRCPCRKQQPKARRF